MAEQATNKVISVQFGGLFRTGTRDWFPNGAER